MIKKKNEKDELILYENEFFIEDSGGRPDILIGWLNKDDVGKVFKTQDLIMQLKGLGEKDNDDIVVIPNKKKIKLTIEVIED